jgi:hypothetical protein
LDYEGYGEESMHDSSRPPSEPSRDVIFLGLDLNVDEEVVSYYVNLEASFSSRLVDMPVSASHIPLAHILAVNVLSVGTVQLGPGLFYCRQGPSDGAV